MLRDPLESRRRPGRLSQFAPLSSSNRPGPTYNSLSELFAGLEKENTTRQMETSRDKRKSDSVASSQTFSDGIRLYKARSDRLGVDSIPSTNSTSGYRSRPPAVKGRESHDTQQQAPFQSSWSDSSDTASIRFERSLRPSRQSSSRSVAGLSAPERPRPSSPAANRRTSSALATKPTAIAKSTDQAAGTPPRVFCRFRLCTCAVEYEDEETTTSDDDWPAGSAVDAAGPQVNT